MSTTRAKRPEKPAGLSRIISPRAKASILKPGSIPTVKSLVTGADELSKRDTFDLARGHLSRLPGVGRQEEVDGDSESNAIKDITSFLLTNSRDVIT